MSDFAGMEDLLQDFLVEAGDLLSDVDNKLVELEHSPDDPGLLNDIFRGFHTIKGGAGFLGAAELVTLCHLTESLFDRLRKHELEVTPERMDVILSATGAVRDMFVDLGRGSRPGPAAPDLLDALRAAVAGQATAAPPAATTMAEPAAVRPAGVVLPRPGEPDWEALYAAVTGAATPVAPAGPLAVPPTARPAPAATAAPTAAPAAAPPVPAVADPLVAAAFGRRASDVPGASAPIGRREGERQRDNSIRVDTARLDQVLNLSGEIGLTKNRLNALRSDILAGRNDTETLQALDLAVSQLDLLVSDLQNAVMKTRMQPIGRLFHKYPRIARDLARNLGKEVELALVGEDTEIDKTMVEDLSDPIIHLIRNAVDHGIEDPAGRAAAGKPAKSVLRLEARQEGDHIVITVADDGRGMDAEKLRAKALAQGVITAEEASTLDERQSYDLIFLPGFSTAEKVSDVSGRGVGMDVVRTNIQKLNGSIEIQSQLGKGTTLLIHLPLTLAILPVLLVRLGEQPFAVPLSMVREILPIEPGGIQDVGGKATMVVRGEVLPIVPLSALLGWPREAVPQYGVVMQSGAAVFILAIDSFAGREDAVIKSLEVFRPKGVAGVTTLANGQIVLILDMKELLESAGDRRSVSRSTLFEAA